MKQVGLVLDAGIEEELQVRQLQVVDVARASLGLPIMEYIVTDTPLKVINNLVLTVVMKYKPSIKRVGCCHMMFVVELT